MRMRDVLPRPAQACLARLEKVASLPAYGEVASQLRQAYTVRRRKNGYPGLYACSLSSPAHAGGLYILLGTENMQDISDQDSPEVNRRWHTCSDNT